jgi:fatty-acyl-CoA synthase
MIEGLVQNDFDINIQHILGRMRSVTRKGEVATLREDGSVSHASYGEVARRADRLAAALRGLGVAEGDRVATFAWNSQEHLEAYYAIPCMGAILHTLNIRLFAEQLTYIVNHAQDKLIIVDDSLVGLIEPLAPTFETVEHFIVIGSGSSGSLPNVLRYEELLEAEDDSGFDYPAVDGAAAAALCYTSGTTGNPKGVLYSHRSTVLHAMGSCMTNSLNLCADDRVLEIVPMFHACAWGMPFSCAMVGAAQVMPGRFLQAEPLIDLIKREQVTYAGAVPTIWMDVLRKLPPDSDALDSLQKVICGGSAVSRGLMESFEKRFNLDFKQGYGMTETSPLVATTQTPPGSSGEEMWSYKVKTGRVSPLVEIRIVDDSGAELPWDGEASGELEFRGPWIASGYYGHPEGSDEKFHDGWLRSGDIATIDPEGYIMLTDRAKDVIKSGGEWISSVDLENALMAHPQVVEAAVIAKPDPRWDERPLACVVVEEGASLTPESLKEHLSSMVAKWWLPEDFAFIAEVPKTSVGKFDKKVLRKQLADGDLEVVSASRQATTA